MAESEFLEIFHFSFVGNLKTDTLGIGFVMSNPRDFQKKDTVFNIGQWLPVIFQGKNGFMFSSFLGPIWEHPTEEFRELDENYRFRNGSLGFSNYPEIDPTWVWHGLFKIKNGFEIRPVKLRYLNHSNRIEILTDDPVQPIYKFGSKEKWPRQKLQNLKDKLPNSIFWDSENVEQLPKYHEFGLHFSKSGNSGINLNWAIIRPDGQFQWLELENDGNYNQINWIGDLDGDGKLDYIFEFNGIGGYEDLYLSSAARDGEAVRLVARLWYFGC